ncbi:thiamine pyrophosphate-dependent enzyme [Burkholderia gladioli]|uniref:thiamine pyrophosphate-dependent enzyme n=1 Tax=Burkholderia gladioli TaxID=28095 RepID=UPI003C79B8D5
MAEDGLVKIICSLCERMILFGLPKVKADGADFDAALRRGAGRGGAARAFARGLGEKDSTDARCMSRYCRLVPIARERADERYPIRSRRCRHDGARDAAPIAFLILASGRYAVLQEFAPVFGFAAGETVQGTALPGFDFVALARGFGCEGRRVADPALLREALQAALAGPGPSLLEIVVA